MNLTESVRIALRSLSANKLRSALTMLGIIIGVAAVIALMGVGRGAQAAIDSQINSMGTNLLFVSPGSTSSGGVQHGPRLCPDADLRGCAGPGRSGRSAGHRSSGARDGLVRPGGVPGQ